MANTTIVIEVRKPDLRAMPSVHAEIPLLVELFTLIEAIHAATQVGAQPWARRARRAVVLGAGLTVTIRTTTIDLFVRHGMICRGR